MNKIFLIIGIYFIPLYVLSQNRENDYFWSLAQNDYLKSFGTKYTVFIDELDYSCNKGLVFQPSFETFFNNNFASPDYGNRMMIKLECKLQDTLSLNIKEIKIMCDGVVNNSKELNDKILEYFNKIFVTEMYNFNCSNYYIFRFILYRNISCSSSDERRK